MPTVVLPVTLTIPSCACPVCIAGHTPEALPGDRLPTFGPDDLWYAVHRLNTWTGGRLTIDAPDGTLRLRLVDLRQFRVTVDAYRPNVWLVRADGDATEVSSRLVARVAVARALADYDRAPLTLDEHAEFHDLRGIGDHRPSTRCPFCVEDPHLMAHEMQRVPVGHHECPICQPDYDHPEDH